ncbi:class I SAM-dependent methyltransferase [Candidatus Parcubacteria bacterium]|nr:class I SAM-dependent methyltransferase [Candidatus Parcubacteria bacterium]
MSKRYIKCANCNSDNHELLVKIKNKRKADFVSEYSNVVICSNCGLVFLNPQHDKDDYCSYYKKHDRSKPVNKTIEEIIKNDNRYDERIKAIDFLLENIPRKKKDLRLIDIGSGNGILLYLLKQRGIRGEGLEISRNAIDFSRKMGFEIHEGSIEKHKINKKYNIVTATAMIEHVLNPINSLKKMRELLDSNGYLFLDTPDYMGMNFYKKGIMAFFKFVHTHYYTDISLTSLLQQAGFEVIKINRTKKTKMRLGLLQIVAKKSNFVNTPIKDDKKRLFREFKKMEIKYGFINFFWRARRKLFKYINLIYRYEK